MKNLIFIPLLLLCANSFGQLKVKEITDAIDIGKIAPLGTKMMYCQKVDDAYMFFYKDTRFEHIEEWESFYVKDIEDFDSLHSIVMDNFATMPKRPVVIESPTGSIRLNYNKTIGGRSVRFSSGEGSGISEEFTKRQVDKLFGKK